MGICKLCRTEPAIGKSHIIPKAFHRDLLTDPHKPAAVTVGSSPDQYPRKSPAGIYDEDLLCPSCEARFGPWDQYGAECLIQNFDQDTKVIMGIDGRPRFYESTNWDEAKLRMFALSVLWRAAATTQTFFEQVDIGPHEELLRALVLSGNPGSPDDFSVLFSRWYSNIGNEDWTKAPINPILGKVEGVNFAWLFLGRGSIGMKCDRRTIPRQCADIMLHPGRPARLVAHLLDDSPALFSMNDAYRKAKKLPKLR
jgi:hypothetical protein